MPKRDWLTIHPGTRVHVKHGEGWAYPEGTLIAYVARDGWASVDLGPDTKGGWLGVRHVPYESITELQAWVVS